MTIADNLERVRAAIADAEREVGSVRGSVRLVAASKGQPSDAIAAAVAAGQSVFGENYAQEMRRKRVECDSHIEWHFIGRVQTGNTKDIASAALVHGVGSVEQARALAKRGPVAALLQLALWDEPTKNGFSRVDIERELPSLRELSGFAVRGFMAMPPPALEPRAAYSLVRQLRDQLAPDLVELSMGMSGDFREAILEGASIVRIGTALFGPRAPKAPS